ncbi:MAG: hypothetical protein KGK08_01425 [Acidobacteriota bacterium]|nr:hypothetical protein [Acidobacteriota bacterium]
MSYKRWLGMVAMVMVAITALLAAAMLQSIGYVRTERFRANATDPYLLTEERAFHLRHQECDVLIYGDSTALTGVAPQVVQQRTGLTSCNISVPVSTLLVLGTLPVDAYLQQNRKPRILVLQLGPETLYLSHRWETQAADYPIALLLRDQPTVRALQQLALHPAQAVLFFWPVTRYRLLPDRGKVATFRQTFGPALQRADQQGGLLTLPSPAQTACDTVPRALASQPDLAWLDEMRQRYAAQGIMVVVRASPVPACDPDLVRFQSELAGHVDMNVLPLPITYFNDRNRHMTAEGARVETEQLTDLLSSHLPGRVNTPPAGQ